MGIKSSTATPTITAGSGITIVSKTVATTENGKVATLYVAFRKATATAVGTNVTLGTLGNYKPKVATFGLGYYGSTCVTAQVNTAGTIIIKPTGAQLPAMGSESSCGVTFTYVLA